MNEISDKDKYHKHGVDEALSIDQLNIAYLNLKNIKDLMVQGTESTLK